MKFEILYSIALGIIDSRDKNSNTVDKNVCVITADESIFTGITTYEIINNKLKTTCAENIAIQNMKKAEKNTLQQMIIVNCKTLETMLPCNECIETLEKMNINQEVIIYQNSNSYILLKDILTSKQSMNNPNDDFFDNFENDFEDLSKFNPNYKKEIDENNSKDIDNPLPQYITPQPNIYKNKSIQSHYVNIVAPQSRYVNAPTQYHSQYMNAKDENTTKLTSKYLNNTKTKKIIQEQDNQSMLVGRLQEIIEGKLGVDVEIEEESKRKDFKGLLGKFKTQSKSFAKDKKEDIKEYDELENEYMETYNTKEKLLVQDNQTSKSINSKSRKELIMLAKEKKRQAKKDMKIREAFEKKSKSERV